MTPKFKIHQVVSFLYNHEWRVGFVETIKITKNSIVYTVGEDKSRDTFTYAESGLLECIEPKQKKLVELKAYMMGDNYCAFTWEEEENKKEIPYTIKDGKIFIEEQI